MPAIPTADVAIDQPNGSVVAEFPIPSSEDVLLESSSDLKTWWPIELISGGAGASIKIGTPVSRGTLFLRTRPAQTELGSANITAVTTSGSPGGYTFSVAITSPDTGCAQYADWWEVLDENGELLHRRVLAHSHVSENPFTRSGGSIPIQSNPTRWFGYGPT